MLFDLPCLLCSTALASCRAETISLVQRVEDFLIPKMADGFFQSMQRHIDAFGNTSTIGKTLTLFSHPLQKIWVLLEVSRVATKTRPFDQRDKPRFHVWF